MIEGNAYYKRIDIIRIVSCVLILLYHLNIIPGGFLAVCTFFVLSGYLGCVSALKKQKFSIKEYYINRFKKLYLPLLIVIFITIILAKVIPGIKWTNLKPESLSAIFGYNNFWQLNANLDYFTRHINSPFMHLWYISILIQFELLFPIAFIGLKKLDEKIGKHCSLIVVSLLTAASLGLFIYMASTKEIMVVYYNSFARWFSLLFGVLLAIIHQKYNARFIKIIKKHSEIPFAVYLTLIVLLCIVVSDESSYYAIFMILTSLISARLIEYSTIKTNRDAVKSKMLDYLSKSTYEIYLVQYPILFFANYISVNELLKILLVIYSTIIIGFLIHFLLYDKNKITKIISMLLFGTIIIAGTFLVIVEEDHTQELLELEQKLNENLKEIEAKNAEYINDITKEKEEWQRIIADMESGESQIHEMVSNMHVVGIGDSVLLAASPGLYKKFPNGYFDGKVSRTIVGGRELLSELIDEGKVGDVIILALANNGDYIVKRNKDLMEVVGDRQVFWINAVLADIPEFNEKFEEFAKDYPNLHIIDWEGYSKDHPEYFYADGIHVKGDGVNAYAELVYTEIYNYYLEKYRESYKDTLEEYEQKINEKTKLLEDNKAQIESINNEIDNLKN